jgi:hypothetical protein
MERLNLGAGKYPLNGWENVNPDNVDLSLRPWPWDDDNIDEINASHILEHFTKTDGFLFLLQCYRILRPGGMLHLAVPDMDKFITCRLTGDYTPLDGYEWRSLDDLLGGNGRDVLATECDLHRYMYCEASLAWTLDKAGFDKFWRRAVPGETDNPKYAPISLYMDAVKA